MSHADLRIDGDRLWARPDSPGEHDLGLADVIDTVRIAASGAHSAAVL